LTFFARQGDDILFLRHGWSQGGFAPLSNPSIQP
jgi:hypothetical protein